MTVTSGSLQRIDLLGRRGIAGFEHHHVRGLGEQGPAARQDDRVIVDDQDFHSGIRFGFRPDCIT